MKFLIVGSGAREHAIIENASRCGYETYAASDMRNPGLLRLCKEIHLVNILDPAAVTAVAAKVRPDIIFVGSEESLFAGVSDALRADGHFVIGASRVAADIEKSKGFMRKLMEKYEMYGRLRFKTFSNITEATRYIDEYPGSVAIKPTRQAGGKGVKVIADIQTYLKEEKSAAKKQHVSDIVSQNLSQDLEDPILIEERVEGVEYTLQCFTDGKHIVPLKMVEDHPHAFVEDIGPETGGMGSISGKDENLPFLSEKDYKVSYEIVEKVVKAIELETGQPYFGVLSGQFMLTDKWGPTVIEFYSRLGDPETVNIMPQLLNFDDILEGMQNGSLGKVKARFEEKATAVKIIAPKGYPNLRDIGKGHPLSVDFNAISALGATPYFGSVYEEGGSLYTGGSRAVAMYAAAETIEEAGDIAEKACAHITSSWKLFHRKDIGSKALLAKRYEQASLARDIFKYREERGLIGKTIDWIPGIGRIET
ncbi:MAG: phosphoribosylamine--glycine ligase [Candidatus Methanofastidiosa archaeon]|nr:phosphoribosylamine--glycine ligase [Candidatus Methanofastidiosa archaeon]